MVSIRSIHFDESGWSRVEEADNCITWENQQQKDVLFLHFFPIPPDIPCSLDQVSRLRQSYRDGVSQSNGGLVSVQVIRVQGVLGTRTLFKFPQKPSGMAYVGSLTFPFRDFSFVIKVQCPEVGITGMREAAVLDKLMSSGEVTIDPHKRKIHGWAQDPYDENYEGPSLLNKSEDIKYDAEFPEHPLSRARSFLTRVTNTVTFEQQVLDAPAFNTP